MDASYQQFVDRVGMHWENEGLPRIAGRIFGFLFLQAEPCSLDEMADGLGVSKASVSTDARRLTQLGLLERASRPGDRRDYYAISPDTPVTAMRLKLRSMERFRRLVHGALSLPGTDPAVRERLEKFDRVHEIIVQSTTGLIERLEQVGRSGLTSRPSGVAGSES
ncbi:MAG TPA: MarR family transcriptional regulator [Gemmatimonadaceae bacterium]|nr:MarR family transcriptional regulator [Gemmatimonadaceae bacterium]